MGIRRTLVVTCGGSGQFPGHSSPPNEAEPGRRLLDRSQREWIRVDTALSPGEQPDRVRAAARTSSSQEHSAPPPRSTARRPGHGVQFASCEAKDPGMSAGVPPRDHINVRCARQHVSVTEHGFRSSSSSTRLFATRRKCGSSLDASRARVPQTRPAVVSDSLTVTRSDAALRSPRFWFRHGFSLCPFTAPVPSGRRTCRIAAGVQNPPPARRRS